jgi:hypothetical protein
MRLYSKLAAVGTALTLAAGSALVLAGSASAAQAAAANETPLDITIPVAAGPLGFAGTVHFQAWIAYDGTGTPYVVSGSEHATPSGSGVTVTWMGNNPQSPGADSNLVLGYDTAAAIPSFQIGPFGLGLTAVDGGYRIVVSPQGKYVSSDLF